MRKLQIRSMTAAVRAAGEEGEAPKVAGTGVVYDQWTEIFPGLRERIVRGAIEPAETVKSYFNHDPSMVLATQDSDPPLELKDGDDGLEYVSPIPDTSYGRDLAENLRRRNVQGSSFAFIVPEDGDRIWEDDEGVLHRDINRALLFEVGPVTDPAYVQTSADLRARAGEVQRARDLLEEWRSQHGRTPEGRSAGGVAEHEPRLTAVIEAVRNGEFRAAALRGEVPLNQREIELLGQLGVKAGESASPRRNGNVPADILVRHGRLQPTDRA